MEIGLVGLGKMGYNLALNMNEQGHRVYVLSRSAAKAAEATEHGLTGKTNPSELVSLFKKRRVIWLMVPAGQPVDKMIDAFIPLLNEGDIVVDGGNSHYRDSIRRAEALGKFNLTYADIGISGGPAGARNGACMMVGAPVGTYNYLEPLLKSICLPGGSLRVGENGSGHYVKMVHNGIEYGMMQAIAEGFELIDRGSFSVDLAALAKLWNRGSVIRSWLIELTAKMLTEDPRLEKIEAIAGSSGTGRWTVEEGLATKVPLPVITEALYARYRSEQEENLAARIIAGLRREFGGHEVVKSNDQGRC